MFVPWNTLTLWPSRQVKQTVKTRNLHPTGVLNLVWFLEHLLFPPLDISGASLNLSPYSRFTLFSFLGFISGLESVGTGALLLHPLVLPVRNRPSVTQGASFRYFRSLIAFR